MADRGWLERSPSMVCDGERATIVVSEPECGVEVTPAVPATDPIRTQGAVQVTLPSASNIWIDGVPFSSTTMSSRT